MKSTRLDTDASKGISEEVSKALAVLLNYIDTYRYDGLRNIILGQTTSSGGGGVTESLSSELKNVGCIIFFCRIVN